LAGIGDCASQGAVGSYAGHLIGTVFNNGNQDVAAGGLTATYQFAKQMGTFASTIMTAGALRFPAARR
jgi:hypothetical protein